LEKVNSYDVFDTLIARRYVDNDPLLLQIEAHTKIRGFAQERKNSDDGTRSLLGIYQDLVRKGVIQEHQLMELYKFEVDLEKRHSYGIAENINKVKHGDLLISDMYFSGADILELVRAAGCDKQVTIYQSNADKRTGVLWDRLKDKNLINLHLGDNMTSDVNNALARNIKARHYPNAVESTGAETHLARKDMRNLSLLLREVRLKCAQMTRFFELSNQLNLPWMILCCEILNRKYSGKNIVFLGRDCQLLYKVYNAFYRTAYYLPFSRKVAYAQPEESVGYLKSHLPPNYVLVDISSTGATWEKICALHPFDIEVLIYSDVFKYTSEKPVLPQTFSYVFKNSTMGATNKMVEIFNCANHGVLSKLHETAGLYTAEFGINEMDSEDVKLIHEPIDIAVETAYNYKQNLHEELSQISDVDLQIVASSLVLALCNLNINLTEYDIRQEQYMKEVLNAKNSQSIRL
jgi:hypothetical protein